MVESDTSVSRLFAFTMSSSLSASQQALYSKYIANVPAGFDGHSKSAILKHLVQKYDEAGLVDALSLWLEGAIPCEKLNQNGLVTSFLSQAASLWIFSSGAQQRASLR